ncbi:MAG: hypothetical protein NDJ90_00560 [Oligoflexia bacterium]|nr:hypothetical protein [Oligoflexia bacterium]
MKTLTEFAALTLKNATQTRQELLAAGKTPEELPQALGEALKLEGDKLAFLLAALDAVGTKLNDLKRVIVFALNEGETAPPRAFQKDDKFYVAEYFPPLHQKGAGGRAEPGHGKGRDGKSRDGKKRGKGGRGDRGERGGGRRDDRRGDRDGQRREARAPQPSSGGPKPRITPVSQAPSSAPSEGDKPSS